MRLSSIALLSLALTAVSANYLLDNPFAITQSDSIVSCGTEEDLLQIEYINLNPDPPQKGAILDIDAAGDLSDDIQEGATMDILVKLGVVKLLQKRFDFCEESVKVDKPCPVEKGHQILKHQVELPKDIPPGKYTVNVKVKNPDGTQVTCLNAQALFKL